MPQARETDNNFVIITTPLLPLTVEGVIQSNNSKKITNVTVLVEINCAHNSMVFLLIVFKQKFFLETFV